MKSPRQKCADDNRTRRDEAGVEADHPNEGDETSKAMRKIVMTRPPKLLASMIHSCKKSRV